MVVPASSPSSPASPPSPVNAAVAIQGLTVVRGGATILDDIDLVIPTGAVFGLIGPSGSGKTTLIRAIVVFGAAVLMLVAGSLTLRRSEA